jgi:hypothetical protein
VTEILWPYGKDQSMKRNRFMDQIIGILMKQRPKDRFGSFAGIR